MAKVGAALVALLDSLGSVKADGECDVYGCETDKKDIALKDARFGTGVHLEGMMLIMAVVFMVIVMCAVGCCAGWCVGYFVRPNSTEGSKQVKEKDEAPQRATKAKKGK
eukprot:1286907-Pyramimonas_sp.AAC.1